MEKEVRSFNIEFRQAPESREVDGYAIVFNSLSHNLGGFVEKVSPEAMDGVIERSDVVALLNHDNSRGILGRSRNGKGSLSLSVDEKGTCFRFDAPKTALGDEVLEYLRRGDATQCSFAFTVAADSWRKLDDGTYERTINQIDKLFDVSVLTCTPAYEETSVSCRSFEAFKEQEAEEERKLAELEKEEQEKRDKEEQEKAEAERQAKLKENWEKLVEENKKYMLSK